MFKVIVSVFLTTYTLSPTENGNDCRTLACGYHLFDSRKIGKVIAVSRDLLNRFPIHSTVKISNAGKFSGVYRVEDVMNKRFTNKVDVLVNDRDNHYAFSNVTIQKIR